MARTQQQQPVQRALVEEKTYRVPFAEGSDLARRAVEHAFGVKLEELAPGMWAGSKQADEYSTIEAMVRTVAVDDGTSVEIQLEHRYNAKAITLFTLGIFLGCILLVPLVPTIILSNRWNKKHERDRLVQMHRAWTEVGNAMNAPRTTSYRDVPKRAYAPVRVAAANDAAAQAEAEAEAEAEQAEAEAAARGAG